MSESVDYRAEFNIEEFVDKYVERVNREIDQRVLDKVEHQLAEYGYVKVVRCRDCRAMRVKYGNTGIECWMNGEPFTVEPDGFCAWAKRKEVGE